MRWPHLPSRLVVGLLTCAVCVDALQPDHWPPRPHLPHSGETAVVSIGSNTAPLFNRAAFAEADRLADWE
jgi:hypothetical protein